MCEKQIDEFSAGNFLLKDAPWSKRPIKLDNEIETFLHDIHYVIEPIFLKCPNETLKIIYYVNHFIL